MIAKNGIIYSEVFSVLNLLGSEYIEKIPKELFNLIKKEKDEEYNPSYVLNLPFEKQDICKQSLAIITLLNLNYWCKAEEKEIIRNNIAMNDKAFEKKYSHENVFKKIEKAPLSNEHIEENSKKELIEYKEPIFTKILNKILSVFKK